MNLDARATRDARREGRSRENRGEIVARGSFVALARPWTRARERVDGTCGHAPVDEKVHSRVDLVLFGFFQEGRRGYRLFVEGSARDEWVAERARAKEW